MECFKVYANEIEGRIDPNPYHPVRLNAIKKVKTSKYQLLPLREVAEFKKQLVTLKSSDLVYVGLENIESNTGVYIPSAEEKESFGTALKFEKGDVLFPKLRPYLNKVYLAEFDGVCSTEFHVLKAIKCNNMYLFCFLNSQLIVNQTYYLMTGNTLPRLQTEEVEILLIPIPPFEIQKKIVDLIKEAYAHKKSKQAEAKQLLDSIDDYVLDELGIKLPELKDKMVYVVNSEEVQNKRVDTFYYQPKFEEVEKAIKKGKYNIKPLNKVVDFIPGYAFKSSDYVNSGIIPLLRIQNITDWGINFDSNIFLPNEYLEKYKKFKLLDRDILISMTGAKEGAGSVGKVAINEKKRVGLVNQRVGILRVRLNEIKDYYLYSYLKTKIFRILLIRNSVISVQVNASEDDILKILIPIPPLEIQSRIAGEVKTRMQKAKQLQEEAKNILEEAKEKIERIILGEEVI